MLYMQAKLDKGANSIREEINTKNKAEAYDRTASERHEENLNRKQRGC